MIQILQKFEGKKATWQSVLDGVSRVEMARVYIGIIFGILNVCK